MTARTPGVDGLDDVLAALREWQSEGAPTQLHPGDLGWFWRFGAQATAAAVRTWTRRGRLLAVGLLDGATQLRLAIAPDARQDEDLAHQLVADVTHPQRGILPAGRACIDAPAGALVRDLLIGGGWNPDQAWTTLAHHLGPTLPPAGPRIEVVGAEQVGVRVAVQRASFARSTFTVERWHAMASGPPYADARCLVAHDDRGDAVAAVTVWSAGPGRPGLLEPLGVHPDHRGRGYGTAISLAAAAALRDLGASSALVCTPSSHLAAVATYTSAGFRRLGENQDLCRDDRPGGSPASGMAG